MPTALITGATAGVGMSFARALARRGYRLVLVARDAVRLSATAALLHAVHAVEVTTVVADLSDHADIERVAAHVEDPSLPVDLLVNNAGFGPRQLAIDPGLVESDFALDVMCLAVRTLGDSAGAAMRERGHGRIVNVAMLATWIAEGHHSAIRLWVKAYSDELAAELAGTGVEVTALLPKWLRSEFHEGSAFSVSAIPERVWADADRCVAEALAELDVDGAAAVPG
ncbi:MAG: SDR family NAD(P)-dependent oxidoreductase [Actinobacteria bacterium]|nr:SDR family NAD(P)-dependent oxidoreductase [Actinomycetota bacterium]